MTADAKVWESENGKWEVQFKNEFYEHGDIYVIDNVKGKTVAHFSKHLVANGDIFIEKELPKYVKEAIVQAVERERKEEGYLFAIQYREMHSGEHGLLVYDSREDAEDAKATLDVLPASNEHDDLGEEDYKNIIGMTFGTAISNITAVDHRTVERFMYGVVIECKEECGTYQQSYTRNNEDICVLNAGIAYDVYL